jgi:mannose-1-phosphate guanylyltransferase/mannose-6-phosphate isomerase
MEVVDEIETVIRPWGEFTRYCQDKTVTVQLITLEQGETLSLQSHDLREELWVALDPGLVFEIEGKETRPRPGDKTFIRRGQKHRIKAPDSQGRILEISFGKFEEDDEHRYEDKYGRINQV